MNKVIDLPKQFTTKFRLSEPAARLYFIFPMVVNADDVDPADAFELLKIKATYSSPVEKLKTIINDVSLEQIQHFSSATGYPAVKNSFIVACLLLTAPTDFPVGGDLELNDDSYIDFEIFNNFEATVEVVKETDGFRSKDMLSYIGEFDIDKANSKKMDVSKNIATIFNNFSEITMHNAVNADAQEYTFDDIYDMMTSKGFHYVVEQIDEVQSNIHRQVQAVIIPRPVVGTRALTVTTNGKYDTLEVMNNQYLN